MEVCVKREVYEEAGVQIDNLSFRGITNICNPELSKRHIIFNDVAESYTGKIKERCDEGDIQWMQLDSIEEQKEWNIDCRCF